MIIAVDTRFLSTGYADACNYFSFDRLYQLCNTHPRHRFLFISDKPLDAKPLPKNAEILITGPEIKNSLLLQYWYNYKLPTLLRKQKADVFVAANGICSLRTKIPQCLLVTDTSFINEPSCFTGMFAKFYKKNMRAFIAKAASVITASEFALSTLLAKFNDHPDKMKCITRNAEEIFAPVSHEEREEIKNKYTNGKEYFLSQAGKPDRDNLLTLLKAFSFFKKRQRSNMLFLIAGDPGEAFMNNLKTYKYRNEVTIIPAIKKKDRARITASAYAFVHVPRYDDTAMSALEAMQCGVPVIASNTGALPEVCEEAALYVNPGNFEDIAQKIMIAYKDEEQAKEMVRRGTERARLYQDAASPEQIWLQIKKVANG